MLAEGSNDITLARLLDECRKSLRIERQASDAMSLPAPRPETMNKEKQKAKIRTSLIWDVLNKKLSADDYESAVAERLKAEGLL